MPFISKLLEPLQGHRESASAGMMCPRMIARVGACLHGNAGIFRVVSLGIVLGGLPACDMVRKYEGAWKDYNSIALTDGYVDYQGEMNLSDDEVIIFSYGNRPGSKPLLELRERITTQYPCYEVTEETETRLVLRCRDRSRGHRQGTELFGFLWDKTKERVFVLVMGQVPRSEARYQQFAALLESVRRTHKPRAPKKP